jgi:hypothetical protein
MRSFKQFAEDGAAGVGTGVAGVAGAGDDKNTVPVSKKMQKKYVAAAMGEQNDPDSQQQREKSKMSADVKQRKNADLVRTQTVQKHTLDRRASVLGPHSETPAVKAPSSGVSNRVGPQNPRKITGAVNMESFANFHKKNTKIKASTSSVGPQTFMTKENLDEATVTGNPGYGYHGNIEARDDKERDKRYSAAHTYLKKFFGERGHLQDAKQPNTMVKHFLDSPHGRHLAHSKMSEKDVENRFSTFKKTYDPKMHEQTVKEDTVKNQKELIAANSKTAEDPTGFAQSTKGRLIDIGNQVLNKKKVK